MCECECTEVVEECDHFHDVVLYVGDEVAVVPISLHVRHREGRVGVDVQEDSIRAHYHSVRITHRLGSSSALLFVIDTIRQVSRASSCELSW